jgi:hypothetical protein
MDWMLGPNQRLGILLTYGEWPWLL